MRSLFPALVLLTLPAFAQEPSALDRALDQALRVAGDNRPELESALAQVPADQRASLEFLIEHMPPRDLTSLDAAFLLQNVDLAHEARAAAPWRLSDELFQNEVLPYANINEERENWRASMYTELAPLVAECETITEAALKLNKELFPRLGVKYSTKRNRPDQAPAESIETGLASCTGLSILLVDACRAVGVPARVTGTGRWADVPGNHTWVEVWDGAWHFVGAAEPDGRGVDHAWFTGRAASAQPGGEMAIYAVSYARTGTLFRLPWAPDQDYIHAVDVTTRYSGEAERDALAGISEVALGYFLAEPDERARFTFDVNLERLLKEDEEGAREAVWTAYRDSPIHADTAADFEENRVRAGSAESPYVVRAVGERPIGGWPLVIAMHGGGGVPTEVNDSQWEHMQRYYHDHPDTGGYLYLALRAPNDVWNGFYDSYCWPLVTKLIRQFLLFGDVDPDRVYLIGYSHGGYGAFAIGTRIPDRFAAVHASAAAPTPGITSARNLRNTPFSFMIGENDTAYGRAERCQAFAREIEELRAAYEDAYPVRMEWIEGAGHGGLPDRDKTAELLQSRRVAAPAAVTWVQTDGAVSEFAWLSASEPGRGKSVDAVCANNRVTLAAKGAGELVVWLDGRLVDTARAVEVERDGTRTTVDVEPSLAALCESLARRGDPRLAFTAKVVVSE